MTSMTDEDKSHPDNVKTEGDDTFAGPNGAKRGCTDILCLIIMGAAMFVMFIIGFIVTGVIESDSLPAGNPDRLIRPTDSLGDMCGVDKLESRPVGYPLPKLGFVCIDKCPTSFDAQVYYCQNCADGVDDCSDPPSYKVDCGDNNGGFDNMAECLLFVATGVDSNQCMVSLQTEESFGYCTPISTEDVVALANATAHSETMDDFEAYFADIYNASGVIFGVGIGMATLFGFLYLFALSKSLCLDVIIWGSVGGIGFCFVAGAAMANSKAVEMADDTGKYSDTEVSLMKTVSYIALFVAFLYVCFVCFMRKRIVLGLAVVKQSCAAIGKMPLLVFYPIISCCFCIVFLVPWTIFCLYLASSGETETYEQEFNCIGDDNENCQTIQITQWTYSDNQKNAALYMLFCWYWFSQFIIAVGQIVVAMSLAMWYFCRDKSDIGNSTPFKAIKLTAAYHLGTAAYGSLIIAIIKTIRAVITYLQNKAKKSGSKVAQIVLCCIQCFLWCLEKCMKFMNKNAYIQTAIFGYSFCKASRKAFFLILRNAARVLAVLYITNVVLVLGSVVITSATTFVGYIALGYVMSDELHGIVIPVLFIAFLAYFIAEMFNETLGMATYTILQCYIADEEMISDPAKRFAVGALRSAVEETATKAQQHQSSSKVGPDVAKTVEPELL